MMTVAAIGVAIVKTTTTRATGTINTTIIRVATIMGTTTITPTGTTTIGAIGTKTLMVAAGAMVWLRPQAQVWGLHARQRLLGLDRPRYRC